MGPRSLGEKDGNEILVAPCCCCCCALRITRKGRCRGMVHAINSDWGFWSPETPTGMVLLALNMKLHPFRLKILVRVVAPFDGVRIVG